MADTTPLKMLIRRHSEFHDETWTNPAGHVVAIHKAKTRVGGVSFVVSVNGRRRDSCLSLGKARQRAKRLYAELGALV